MSLEGRQLGEFEIHERLGQGGMGAVYRARQISLDRIVALKTLQSSLADDADYIARFRQEAKAAALLSHPNLVHVHSAGETEGLHWFAMEYIEGESAQARLDRKGRIDPLDAIAIVMNVATALDYGWRKAALIHRDIKPDNIFLSSDGGVKLGDLGLAKSAGQVGITTAGTSIGTPHYISPEQAEGVTEVDLRADIYSLGCTLFHLLAGQPPYAGSSAMAVMLKHVNAAVPDLRNVWPECPAELAAAVMKMMQKLPAERQQSYEEVCADLQRAYDVLAGASAPSLVGAKRRPVAAWVGGAIAAGAVVAALLYFAPWKKPSSSTGTPPVAQSGAPTAVQRVNTPATPAANTLAATASPSPKTTPASATPRPEPTLSASPTPTSSPSPKPPSEVEKWLAQVDGVQQEAFQKQVQKPFETATADLRARYLASVDASIARASTAGQLQEALAWRTERQAFEKARNVPSDDAGAPPAIKTLRESFRQQFARLDADRATRAKALYTQYDTILAQNQTLLTQRERLDDAVLLKKKRGEIALAWLGSPSTGDGAARHPELAKPGSPLLATKERPFVNTLGMKFAPVAITSGPTTGKRILFSVWLTRVQDYAEYARAKGITPAKPKFEQGPTHPVVIVTWDDANSFCQWLTATERASGRIGAHDEYRLPSDHEWSSAVGIGNQETAGESPGSKNGKIVVYPWGPTWPPPKGAGNYSGRLQVDEFGNTSPVGSFSANENGLYDMGGNVSEWCEDWYDAKEGARVLRGASWKDNTEGRMRSSSRFRDRPSDMHDHVGFRCLLVIAED